MESVQGLKPIEAKKVGSAATEVGAGGETKILFVCGQNAGRSQMEQAIFQKKITELHEDRRIIGASAGLTPAPALNPVVKEALDEYGVDTKELFPKPITSEAMDKASVVVVMGCDVTKNDKFVGKNVVAWEFEDAKGKDLEAMRDLRVDIERKVDGLIKQLVSH